MIFTLSGCWDATDIQNKDIALTIMEDYKDGNYYYYTELADIFQKSNQQQNAGNQSSGTKTDYIVAQGKTLVEARDETNREADKPLTVGADRAIIWTDRFAENGVEEFLNRIRGESDFRQTVPIVTTSSEPEEIYNSPPENAQSIGGSVDDTLTSLTNTDTNFEVHVGDLLQAIAVKNVGFLVPAMDIVNKQITLNGYSVFKNAKLIGEIPADQRDGIVYFLNKNAKDTYEITNNNIRYTIDVDIKQMQVTPHYSDGKVSFDINMKFDGKITYVDKMTNISDEDIKAASDNCKEKITDDINLALETSQKTYSCDYLKLYRYFRAKYQQKFYNSDWSKLYSNANMNVSVDLNLQQGNTNLTKS
jgi:Ger(x)C family germination protein